jgi:hypothetical protein
MGLGGKSAIMLGWFQRPPKIPDGMIRLRSLPFGNDGAPVWTDEIEKKRTPGNSLEIWLYSNQDEHRALLVKLDSNNAPADDMFSLITLPTREKLMAYATSLAKWMDVEIGAEMLKVGDELVYQRKTKQ